MYQTALVWEDGADTGGSPILDYRITYSEENGPEQILRQGIATKSYIAAGLDTGVTYSFKIQARNA